MPLDGIVLKSISNELSSCLLGARIEKIFQPGKDEVIFFTYNNKIKSKLLLSANAVYPRIHITNASFDNPAVPFNFCILLRKHLTRARIVDIYQPGLERIVEIKLDAVNEIGDHVIRFVIVEIMGKHSNIILLNDNRKIIDSIKHIDFEISSVREVLPGRNYAYPKTQDKIDLIEADFQSIQEKLASISSDESKEKFIVKNLTGFSPFFAKLVVGKTDRTSENYDYSYIFNKVKKYILENKFSPFLLLDKDGLAKDFHCLFPECFDSNLTRYYTNINELIDYFYSSKSHANIISQKKSVLLTAVRNKLEKCRKKVQIQSQKLDDVKDREQLKIFGELLTANLYKITDYTKEIAVDNFYSQNNEDVIIPLDSNLSPSKNAQLYYKRYQKAKNTFEAASKLLSQVKNDEFYLESLILQIEQSENEDEISEIREELISQGILNAFIKKKTTEKIIPYHEFLSTDGFKIIAGKNNKQNDRITFKLSSKSDIWLHARNIPGSHVLIRTDKRDVPDTTLLEAAAIAAFYSKFRESKKVPVDYTFIKYVKKPGNSKPGFVIYENFKTINAEPSVDIIDRLIISL